MKNTLSIVETKLTVEKLREYLDYNLQTGFLTWKRKPAKNIVVGTRAGSLKSDGYRYIRFDNIEYMEHRFIWFGMTGKWPTVLIDHEDNNKSNNTWSNLREADYSTNGMNTGLKKNNTSGHKGIRFSYGKYRARIKINQKEIHIGSYSTFEEAVIARNAKEIELFGKFSKEKAMQG